VAWGCPSIVAVSDAVIPRFSASVVGTGTGEKLRVSALTAVTTQNAAPAILLGGHAMLRKALFYYAATFVAVAVLARAAIVGIGLPDWVFPGAMIVMALGLPVILATAWVHRVTHRVLVASMDVETIEAFRRACPEVATSMSRREALVFFGLQRAGLDAAYSPPVQALQVPYWFGDRIVPTADFVTAARRRNFKVHVWTINDDERLRELIRIGVDGVLTDRPDRLLALLGRPAKSR